MPEELDDNIEDMEAHETARTLPLGWVILYIGLIVWGGYYVVKYLPAISGWTQEGAYEQSVAEDDR